MNPLVISAHTLTSATGTGRQANADALRKGNSGLRACDLESVRLDTHIGRVAGVEGIALKDRLAPFQCRNHQLAELGLRQDGFIQAVEAARARYGAGRIAILMGTSTSGIAATEQAYHRRNPATGELPPDYDYQHTQNMFSLADFVATRLELRGPAMVTSTACSSSAKVFADAERFIAAGLCDAAVVGGVDSLCGMTLHGFNALQLVAPGPCRPLHAERAGISIGEAAGFFLLEKADSGAAGPRLIGYGESSDAHHMSAPHPEGLGAARAMEQALQRARLPAEGIDYVLMHATATPANDRSEARALVHLFGADSRATGTKGLTGHTLGAAGAVGVAQALASLERGFVPATAGLDQPDPELQLDARMTAEERDIRHVLVNAFGFGGNNCSLLLEAA
ncbi:MULTISPECIES: beta-ketoacyl-[acyl-carrier-protein] synthase family protein [unclassified Thioalkalivibrio]|uniref:beta-ketoacyl-[acyl-carrier-protein] synthase family protein n=1 Tax=unclassified Thioalkalivibrio TaxID=2621013 RepID=UPI00037552CD|nr:MULTISPECIES: beta-ketoacyl-[acyl-carrier-protein] synthase family protein [unclassified Thioalkalivibrio]